MGGVGPTAAGTGSGEKTPRRRRGRRRRRRRRSPAAKRNTPPSWRVSRRTRLRLSRRLPTSARRSSPRSTSASREMRQVHAADVESAAGRSRRRACGSRRRPRGWRLRALHEVRGGGAHRLGVAPRGRRGARGAQAREATLRRYKTPCPRGASGASEEHAQARRRPLNENGELASPGAPERRSSVSVSDHGVAVSPASTKSAAEVSKTVEEMDAIAQKYIAGRWRKEDGGSLRLPGRKEVSARGWRRNLGRCQMSRRLPFPPPMIYRTVVLVLIPSRAFPIDRCCGVETLSTRSPRGPLCY